MWVRVNEAKLEATKLNVAKVNERAQKRGFTGRIDLAWERVEVQVTDDLGFERTEIWYDVELAGEAPKYNGWTFLATLEWDELVGLTVRSAPGARQVDRSQLKKDYCDHCRVSRPRSKTYVVLNEETNQQVQVGSTCMKDFLGWSASVPFLDEDSLAVELDLGMGSISFDRVDTLYVLALAWALIKLDGYRSSSSPNGSTKSDVMDVIWPPRSLTSARREELSRIRALADEAKVRAKECLAWVLSDDFSGGSDYVRNLKTIAAADTVTIRHIGFLVSAPQAWAKWQGETLIKSTEQSSNWVGAPKERITFTATIRAIRFIESNFGAVVLYSMCTAAGDIIKWFASREVLGDKIGETFTLKATVKAHETFRDIKQTVVTRAKIVEA